MGPSLYYIFVYTLNNLVSLFSSEKAPGQIKSTWLALSTHRDGHAGRKPHKLADGSHFKFLTTVLREVLLSTHQSYNISIIHHSPVTLNKWSWNLRLPQNHLEGTWKLKLLGPLPKFLDQLAWGWGLRNCITNKCPGDAAAAGVDHTLRNNALGDYLKFFSFSSDL